MRYEYRPVRKRFGERRSLAEPRTDFLLVGSIILSMLIHALFLLGSTRVRVAVARQVEQEIGRLFKVSFRDLNRPALAMRERAEQMRREREESFQKEIEEASAVPTPDIDEQLKDLLAEAGEPEQPGLSPEEVPQGLEAAGVIGPPAVITSDAGVRRVGRSMGSALRGAVKEEVQIERPAVGPSVVYRQERIVATLPPDLAESVPEPPEMTITPPALDVPAPDFSLQPAISLQIEMPKPDFQARPVGLADVPPSTLTVEQRAKQAIAEKFVRLDDVLNVDVVTYRKGPKEGYFKLRIRPKIASERLQPLPKDVIFVLDASASMGRRTLEVLKKTIKQLLLELKDGDRFNVVGFKNRVEMFSDELVPASPLAIGDAREFIGPLRASGKTDIYTSLEPLMTMGTERARPLLILLYSDGRPTIGVKNTRDIINRLSALRGPSTSVYGIGTGDDVNQYLLDFLAYRNRGRAYFVASRDDIQPRVQAFFDELKQPLLLRVSTDFVGISDRAEIYPKELPDLYQDSELEIWGRFTDEKQLTVRLVGEAYDERKEMVTRLEIPDQDSGGPEIARQWALHKIYYLISLIVQHGEQPDILAEINRLSKEYGIVTPYHEQFQG